MMFLLCVFLLCIRISYRGGGYNVCMGEKGVFSRAAAHFLAWKYSYKTS